jgi:hypothetical protein
MKLGKTILFHIGTGADIRPQKRIRKITVRGDYFILKMVSNIYISCGTVALMVLGHGPQISEKLRTIRTTVPQLHLYIPKQ